ncbi:MAG: toxin [Proteobacteria bacterium]|nr:toxin [Pseudomonadota bacterium]
MKLAFFETPAFTRYLFDYLNEEEYRSLQNLLLENPNAGEMIAGTGGFRKLRWRDRQRSKGKKGGLRIIYYHLYEARQIWFFTLYNKGEASDLTIKQKRILKSAINAEKASRRIE